MKFRVTVGDPNSNALLDEIVELLPDDAATAVATCVYLLAQVTVATNATHESVLEAVAQTLEAVEALPPMQIDPPVNDNAGR